MRNKQEEDLRTKRSLLEERGRIAKKKHIQVYIYIYIFLGIIVNLFQVLINSCKLNYKLYKLYKNHLQMKYSKL